MYTLTSFVSQFGNILVLPLIWNGLQIEDFAVIGIIEASTPFLSCVLSLSSEQYLTRFYYAWNDDERLSKIGKNLTLCFLSVFLIGLFVMAVLLIVSLSVSLEDVNYFVYGLLHIIFFSTFVFPNSLFRIANNTSGYIAFTLSLFFVRLLLNYIFTISLGWGLDGYIISNALSSFLFFVIIYIYLFNSFRFTIDRVFFKESLRFTLPYIPTNLYGNISTLTDRLVLGVYGGKFEVGLLTLGQKIASVTGSLSQAIKLGYVPYISEFISREKYSLANFNMYRMMFVAPISVLSLFLVLFGVELLSLIGMDVMGVNKYLYLFLFTVYLNSNNLFFSPGLYLSKRSDKMWIPNFFQLVIRFIFYYLLVPTFMLKGVILASLLASLVSFIYNYILSEKYFKLNLGFLSIGLQFLPFLFAMGMHFLGIDIIDISISWKVLVMCLYLLILWFFLFNNYEKQHTKTA